MVSARPSYSRFLSATLFVVFALLITVGCVGLFQDRLIFFPHRLDEAQDLGFTGASEEVFLDTDDGARIHGLFFEAPAEARGVVLYFHGNAGSVASWYPVAQNLTAHAVDVFLLDYRTYGKSRGRLSEEGLYSDGDAAYLHLRERGFAPEEIIVYGRSLGAAVATHVAHEHPVGGLILETPFQSLTALARELYPFFFPGLFLRYDLNNEERAAGIDTPTLVFHGTRDEIIPLEHSRRVFDAFPQGWELKIIEGGTHNDLPSFPEHDQTLRRYFDDRLNER